MSLDTLRETLPAYAKDISLNLSSLAGETVLTDQQKWGAFLASAHAIGVAPVLQAIEASAQGQRRLSDEAADGGQGGLGDHGHEQCLLPRAAPSEEPGVPHPAGPPADEHHRQSRASTSRTSSCGARPSRR
jgi:hypothetical protein